jgi:purine-nucleoside phosphorylase
MLVSGSGLAVDLGRPVVGPLPMAELLPFDVRAVPGHTLSFELLRQPSGHHVLYLRGRLHTYQGYDPHQAVFLLRLGASLGAKNLLMTNAAGGLRPTQRAGQLVLLRDHINLTGLNPLRGELPEEWGVRFPDMVGAYDLGLRQLARAVAAKRGIELDEGVYVGLAGPSYETPAEVAMLRLLGGDVVGMSTVLEVIAARQMGVRSLVISLVTNLAAAVGTDHQEVLEAGRAARSRLESLFGDLLQSSALHE